MDSKTMGMGGKPMMTKEEMEKMRQQHQADMEKKMAQMRQGKMPKGGK